MAILKTMRILAMEQTSPKGRAIHPHPAPSGPKCAKIATHPCYCVGGLLFGPFLVTKVIMLVTFCAKGGLLRSSLPVIMLWYVAECVLVVPSPFFGSCRAIRCGCATQLLPVHSLVSQDVLVYHRLFTAGPLRFGRARSRVL